MTNVDGSLCHRSGSFHAAAELRRSIPRSPAIWVGETCCLRLLDAL